MLNETVALVLPHLPPLDLVCAGRVSRAWHWAAAAARGRRQVFPPQALRGGLLTCESMREWLLLDRGLAREVAPFGSVRPAAALPHLLKALGGWARLAAAAAAGEEKHARAAQTGVLRVAARERRIRELSALLEARGWAGDLAAVARAADVKHAPNLEAQMLKEFFGKAQRGPSAVKVAAVICRRAAIK